jgi:type VI secretion system protein ImpL
VVQRWRGIQRDLERYRLKNPNSSLVGLEQFLLTNSVDLDRLNCAEKLTSKGPGARPADYFGERYQQIYASLNGRCAELRTHDVQEQWAQFAGSFNRTLAGRQPFTQVASRDVPAADVEEVGQMIKTYDRVAPIFKHSAPENGRLPTTNAAARRFAEQFERVKAFLAPLYPAEEGAAAGYDVIPEFRANQGAEVDGNKVIDWTLEIGGQVARWRDPPKALRWEPGAPVTLTLRLAKDSPASPMPDLNQPAMQVEGKAVVFRFTDAWALLSMIQRQREPDTSAREARTQLLRLEFPLAVASPDTRGAPLESRSRVYLRLTLSPVGKKTPVAWPGAFPVRAPEWSGP